MAQVQRQREPGSLGAQHRQQSHAEPQEQEQAGAWAEVLKPRHRPGLEPRLQVRLHPPRRTIVKALAETEALVLVLVPAETEALALAMVLVLAPAEIVLAPPAAAPAVSNWRWAGGCRFLPQPPHPS